MTEYPTPTRAERRAWALKKQDDRARASYRSTLPQGIQVLTAMLEDAPSPWHAEVIQTRIDERRADYRVRNRRRRAAAREAEDA